ncbi:hypothetical protein GCM10010350_66550 [Streptomyces galilaeus]|nr:hypothetical protein GCM10010350_66550 [Streptomyces galilaeus]
MFGGNPGRTRRSSRSSTAAVRVALPPGRFSTSLKRRIETISHALGYGLYATENLGRRAGVRLRFICDDSPDARRQAEQTIVRLHAGGPVQPHIQEPPPAPPSPTPPLTPRQPASRPRQSLKPQPPPPAVPPRPRIPPRPLIPPAPTPLPPPIPQAADIAQRE